MKIPSRWLPYVQACAAGAVVSPVRARAETLLEGHQRSRKVKLARSLPRRKAARAERQAESAATRAVRRACETRARGRSELSGDRGRLELDHYFGRDLETIETCWMLTSAEHLEKTNNRPSRLAWHLRFREHCQRHGYGRALALLEPLIALEEGQHPGRAELAR